MKLKSIPRIRSSIKAKLIVISFLLLTIPLIVLGVLSYEKSKSSMNMHGVTNLSNSVEMTLDLIDALNAEVEKGSLPIEEAQERVKIAILGEKNTDGTRPINEKIDIGENGYLYVLDEKGVLLAHPNLEGQSLWDEEDSQGVKFIQEVIKKGNNGGGLTYYEWPLPDNENKVAPKVTYSKTDPSWGWTVVSGSYMMDFNKPANEILNLVLLVTGIAVLAGFIIIWIFSNKISRPIKKVMERMNHLANGDLTRKHIHLKTKDETGQLAVAMNQLQTKLKTIIHNISKASETIASQSEELTQAADEVKTGSEHVATTMQELASGSETQANGANELILLMEAFGSKIKEAHANGDHISQSSGQVLNLTDDGHQLMDSSTMQMEKIDQIVRNAVQKVRDLDVQSQKISNLITVIREISDQTNLLALNAAIEAARAVEHGQGFAIVAFEVRKLAEQVSESVTDITGIVESIRRETSIVAETLQGGYQEVQQGTSQIKTTNETFKKISASVTEMANNIATVSENLATITENSEKMNTSIREIASISEESAAGVEQTSASAQQTTSSMEEVTASSNELAKLAEKLNGLVQQFKT